MNDKPVPQADDEHRDDDPFDHAPHRGCSAWWIMIILAMIFLVWYALTGWWTGMLKRPKGAQAQAIAVTIINAIDQFHTDYDLLPMPTGAVTGQDWNTDSSAKEGVIASEEHPNRRPGWNRE